MQRVPLFMRPVGPNTFSHGKEMASNTRDLRQLPRKIKFVQNSRLVNWWHSQTGWSSQSIGRVIVQFQSSSSKLMPEAGQFKDLSMHKVLSTQPSRCKLSAIAQNSETATKGQHKHEVHDFCVCVQASCLCFPSFASVQGPLVIMFSCLPVVLKVWSAYSIAVFEWSIYCARCSHASLEHSFNFSWSSALIFTSLLVFSSNHPSSFALVLSLAQALPCFRGVRSFVEWPEGMLSFWCSNMFNAQTKATSKEQFLEQAKAARIERAYERRRDQAATSIQVRGRRLCSL